MLLQTIGGLYAQANQKAIFARQSSRNLSRNFKSPLHTFFILGSYKTRKETVTMMGFGFLFMLALFVLPVILTVVLVNNLSDSK
jgi:hypothetical protein